MRKKLTTTAKALIATGATLIAQWLVATIDLIPDYHYQSSDGRINFTSARAKHALMLSLKPRFKSMPQYIQRSN